MRSSLIKSIAKINYLISFADQDIEKIVQSLNRIEDQVLSTITSL